MLPVWSWISKRFPLLLTIRLRDSSPVLPTLPVSALGTAPAMIGRSGSPSMWVRITSVPFRSGKWNPASMPEKGCAMRTRREAAPGLRPSALSSS